MTAGAHSSEPVRIVLRDATDGRWLQFSHPKEIVVAHTEAEVMPGLRRVEEAVDKAGLHAAGFVAYEASPAFDPALVVKANGEFPLLWFGLYERPEPIELPGREALQPVPPLTWESSVTAAKYRDAVQRIKAWIHSGDTYQVNYTYRLNAIFSGDPWTFFLHLAAAQESSYSAFIDTGEWAICSASPELFFRMDSERLQCRPMKGTAPRGLTQGDDLAQAQALQASEKDRAENVMIVDMVRHDLGRVAEPGSVAGTSLFTVEKFPTLWQMTSTVEAQTQTGLSDIFTALFPPASITGAPKVRTMELIAQLESSPRRIYTGAIGFVAPGRRAQFNVAIRTALIHRKTGRAEYGVGSGIVWDSDPEREWQECATKTRILEAPVPPFKLLETLLWTPEKSYVLLEQHLHRLGESAAYFNFHVDAAAVREGLERFASRFRGPRQRVRLLVTKEGRATFEARPMPEPARKPPRIALARTPVNSSNPFLYHKTTHRGFYDTALVSRPGFDDVLLFNEKGEVTESTVANLVVEIQGKLCTPPVSCGLLPGTLRAHLLEQGKIVEQPITVEQLLQSKKVFLMNSVRGMYEVEVVRGVDSQP